MEYNEGLLKLIDNNPVIYSEIWKCHKQLNPDTTITLVNEYLANVHRPIQLPKSPPMVIRDGLRPLLWRWIGRRFKREDWIKHGMMYEMIPVVKDYDTILLERFGEFVGQQTEIALGYHAGTDTLFVYKR